MTIGKTRKKIRSLIASLGLPWHYDIDTLVRNVEAAIGHAIEIRERDDVGNATATGGLRKEGNRRVILLVRHCSPRTRVMTILHELGHLICGHERVFIRQAEARMSGRPGRSAAGDRGGDGSHAIPSYPRSIGQYFAKDSIRQRPFRPCESRDGHVDEPTSQHKAGRGG